MGLLPGASRTEWERFAAQIGIPFVVGNPGEITGVDGHLVVAYDAAESKRVRLGMWQAGRWMWLLLDADGAGRAAAALADAQARIVDHGAPDPAPEPLAPLDPYRCPCHTWAGDMRVWDWARRHNPMCDGRGDNIGVTKAPAADPVVDVDEDGWCRCDDHQRWKREVQP